MLSTKRHLALAALMLLFTVAAHAAPYQYELDIGYSDIRERDDSVSTSGEYERYGDEVNDERRAAQFVYYPTAVTVQKGPLRERAFLSGSSSLAVSIDQLDYGRGGDSKTLGFDGRYITPSRFVIGLSYKKEELEAEFFDYERRDIGIELGGYLSDTSLVSLTFRDTDNESLSYSSFDGPTEQDSDSYLSYKLAYQQLFSSVIPNRYMAYGLDLTYTDADDGRSMQVDLNSSYYWSDNISVSAGVSYQDIVGFNISTVSFGTEYFFSEQFSSSLSYKRRLSASWTQYDTTSVTLGLRF